MNTAIRTEVNIKDFAKNVARSDSGKQADFINKFANELKVCYNAFFLDLLKGFGL